MRLLLVLIVIPTTRAVGVENNNIGLGTRRDSHNAERRATGSDAGLIANDVAQSLLGGVKLAGETVAATARALDLDAESERVLLETGALEFENRVETKLDESLSALIRVRTSNIWSPVADRLRAVTPDAPFIANTRRVDVIATEYLC